MVVNGLFDISLNLHLQCLRFCFFGVLQHELDETLQSRDQKPCFQKS